MLADQRKAVKAAAAQQDKPQTTAQPAPAPQKTNAPSAADLKKAADKAKREFMAVSEDDRPAQAAALEKWRKARKAAEVAKPTTTTAAPVPEVKPQPKPAAPAPSADTAPAYCEQTSFC